MEIDTQTLESSRNAHRLPYELPAAWNEAWGGLTEAEKYAFFRRNMQKRQPENRDPMKMNHHRKFHDLQKHRQHSTRSSPSPLPSLGLILINETTTNNNTTRMNWLEGGI